MSLRTEIQQKPVGSIMARIQSSLAVALWLLLLPSSASAQQYFGDWAVERNRELVVAITRNTSESAFGYACNRASNECLFFFMPDRLKCNEGGRYALLVNGGNESTARSTVCRKLSWQDGQQFANVIDGSDALRKQLANANESTIGIARGTGADGFSISKFSMRGFREAFDRVNRHREDRDDRRPHDYNTDNRGGVSSIDVELYEHDNFQGRRLEVRSDLANLADHNFNDFVSSIIINRGRWEICTDAFFRGSCATYTPGRYPNVGQYNDQFSSIRRLN